MSPKEQNNSKKIRSAEAISFGFDRATDEKSLALFLACFADRKLLETLLPRLSDEEIMEVVDFIGRLMHKHLSEEEYHELFLSE
jgi:hypothetical protein